MNDLILFFSNTSILQIILCTCLLISAILVNLSANPVESVLFLVLTFVTSGILLMTLLSEFFGITVIIIYVGAIAVLFLFVIMMLNIKSFNKTQGLNFFIENKIAKFSIFVSFLYLCFLYMDTKTKNIFSNIGVIYDNFQLDKLDNIEVLGQVLYNYYIECFLLAGLLLLVALLGSICLTLTYNTTKKGQLPNRQLSRSDKFLSFFE